MSEKFANGFAVVIGVGADLPITVSDAQAVAAMLQDPSRCAYLPEQVRLLTEQGARREHIVQSLAWLAASAGEKDTAIVYFSGHGTDQPNFHLVPYGFDWHDLPGTALEGAHFTRLLQNIHAQKLLVLLDCCHAGGQAEAKAIKKSPLPPEALHQLGQGNGRVVIASSRKNELSWTGNPYSEFTKALLEAFAGMGAFETDGFSRVLDIAFWVARKVPERTRDQQHPILKISNLEDNFAVSWYAAGQKAPRQLPWDTTTTTSSLQDYLSDPIRRQTLDNYRENLLLIEQRISQYVDFTEIPLQLVRNKRETERLIRELELTFTPR